VREQEDRKTPAEARHAPKKMSPAERQAYFLEGLTNTGHEKATQILAHFGSPGRVINALQSAEVAQTKSGKSRQAQARGRQL
jgi:ERCC4-type nuclease